MQPYRTLSVDPISKPRSATQWVLLTSLAYSEHLRSTLTASTLGGRSTVLQHFFDRVLYFFLTLAFKTISFHFR
ncbi:uncharacterized protein METZ01_LOCUS277979, partial [marine metagenome]